MHKILIVEDDELIANVYRNKFAVEGYNVDIAADGDEGYDKMHSFRPDLVILDLNIPKLSGVDLMKKVRAEAAFEKLPIIVFSNTYLSNTVKEAWKAGATKCLSKANCTAKQVIEVVRSVLATGHASETITPPAAPAGTEAKIPFAITAKPKPTVNVIEDTLDATNTFLTNAQKVLVELCSALQSLVKSTDDLAARTKQLDEMYGKIHSLTGASVVGLSLIGQMTDAFEALLKELRDKPHNLNPSTLRTIANAIDFLETLVKRGRAAEAQKGPAPKILVVDDELLSRRAITHALDRAKLPSSDVDDPLTALKLLTDNHYDLVFLDADMPGMNGFELCAKLRSLQHHRKTPVVFVTALNDFEARANSTMAGANDFIGKPFPFIELAVKALIYVLRNKLDAKK